MDKKKRFKPISYKATQGCMRLNDFCHEPKAKIREVASPL